MVHPFTLIWA